jgi:hypothetical protein
MRSILTSSALLVVLLAIGCNLAPYRRNDTSTGGAKTSNAAPTAENLVKYLNHNAELVKADQAINCTNLTIDIVADGKPIGVSSRMICQAPRNFRMSGVVVGSPAVEVGSNEKEFWFWCREMRNPGEPAYLYHCSYDALARGTKIPFPFQPEMVLKALGVAPYDATKPYEMKVVDNKGHKTIHLSEQTLSPQNTQVKKITVFDFHEAQVPKPQVLAHILEDDKGRVICTATIQSTQQVGGSTGVILPKQLTLNWPEHKLQMKMRFENPRVVDMPAAKAATVFNRQGLQYQSFDLASQTLDSAGLQQAGAVYRRP